jgi:Uma2 family endonuclease
MATTLVSVEEYLRTSYEDGDREYLDGQLVETNVGNVEHADVQLAIAAYLRTKYRRLLWVGTAVRVQITPRRFRVPDVVATVGKRPEQLVITTVPLIVVEIVSPDDRVAELEDKVHDYLELGIPNIWVVNPRSRRVLVHTAEGSREVKDALRAQDPAVEIPLAEIFAQ